MKGSLFLIPTFLGDTPKEQILPEVVTQIIDKIDYYIVENEKTARKFIKLILPTKSQPSLKLFTLNKHTSEADYKEMLQPLLEGKNVGLMSEAGCPGIADPGAVIAKLAHKNNITVMPLVGPSSILLAMMASGMNGQNFAFTGYLPIEKSDKKTALKNLEKYSFEKQQSQIFMETPYRNNKFLEDILQTLHPNTRLCIACDITLETQYIKTKTCNEWKKEKVDLHNRPCIFIIQKD